MGQPGHIDPEEAGCARGEAGGQGGGGWKLEEVRGPAGQAADWPSLWPLADGEAPRDHRPAAAGVCQAGSTLQQLAGWRRGGPAGRVAGALGGGDPGGRRGSRCGAVGGDDREAACFCQPPLWAPRKWGAREKHQFPSAGRRKAWVLLPVLPWPHWMARSTLLPFVAAGSGGAG